MGFTCLECFQYLNRAVHSVGVPGVESQEQVTKYVSGPRRSFSRECTAEVSLAHLHLGRSSVWSRDSVLGLGRGRTVSQPACFSSLTTGLSQLTMQFLEAQKNGGSNTILGVMVGVLGATMCASLLHEIRMLQIIKAGLAEVQYRLTNGDKV